LPLASSALASRQPWSHETMMNRRAFVTGLGAVLAAALVGEAQRAVAVALLIRRTLSSQ